MEAQFKKIAALIGDPTRATVLWTLLDGRAFTAMELATAAETSPQNISMHLAKLLQAGLLTVESQGRHKYYKYSRKEIAYAVEAMATLVPPVTGKKPADPVSDPRISYCRSCYDHLAGRVGVALTDSLIKQKLIIARAGVYGLGPGAPQWFRNWGIDTAELQQQRRTFLRPCLDWSERRQHLAGSLPAAMLDQFLAQGWIRRTRQSRVIIVTAKGQKGFQETFKMDL